MLSVTFYVICMVKKQIAEALDQTQCYLFLSCGVPTEIGRMHSNEIDTGVWKSPREMATLLTAAGSQYSVMEPEGQHPDRQISLSATLNPRRCHLLSFS